MGRVLPSLDDYSKFKVSEALNVKRRHVLATRAPLWPESSSQITARAQWQKWAEPCEAG